MKKVIWLLLVIMLLPMGTEAAMRDRRMNWSRLIITDGVKEFDLRPYYKAWKPTIADEKTEIIPETIVLNLHGRRQDSVIHLQQDLHELLVQAAEYWDPEKRRSESLIVWLEARARGETNSRYAWIRAWSTPQDADPFRAPFDSKRVKVMQDFVLGLDRGPWLGEEPTQDTCVELTAYNTYGVTITEDISSPVAQADDVFVEENDPSTWSVNLGAALVFGDILGSGPPLLFMKFDNVAIPQGANVLRAYISFASAGAAALDDVLVNIFAEKKTNVGTSLSFVDLMNRRAAAKTVKVPWGPVEHWAGVGNSYVTPDLTPIIQELVDMGGWVSGNNMGFYIEDAGSDDSAFRQAQSFDTAPAPKLYVQYATPTVFGVDTPTCENEIFVANHSSKANITNVYYYDASLNTWSGNLVGTAPYALFPAVPANGDLLVVGCDNSLPDSGPFGSVVFNISTPTIYTILSRMDYLYWNGALTTLALAVDNTNVVYKTGYNPGYPFSETGINSIHWEQPADIATFNPSTDVGGAGAPNVDLWAVIFRAVPGGGGTISRPTQADELYAINWPYVDIDGDDIDGSMDALMRMENDVASGPASPLRDGSYGYYNWMFAGLRSLSRGSDFSAFLNVSDEQIPTGLTVGVLPGTASMSDRTRAPSGRAVVWSPAGAVSMQDIVLMRLNADLAQQYYGSFHAYLRVGMESSPVAGDFDVQLEVRWGDYYTIYRSDTKSVSATSGIEKIDLGGFTIADAFVTIYDSNQLTFALRGQCNDAASPPDLVYYDLVVMPTDEWAVVVQDDKGEADGATTFAVNNRAIETDSIRSPRDILQAFLSTVTPQQVVLPYSTRPVSRAILRKGRDQRLWFFFDQLDDEPYFTLSSKVQVFAVQRYLAARGEK